MVLISLPLLSPPACSERIAVEYKYVVCDESGSGVGAAWKPGGNFQLSMPDSGNSTVKVKDAWDDAYREVQVR